MPMENEQDFTKQAGFGSDLLDAAGKVVRKLVPKRFKGNPDLDAFMKGKIDLSGISKLVPLEKGTSLSGIITADIIAIGKMSAIEQKRYEDTSSKFKDVNHVRWQFFK